MSTINLTENNHQQQIQVAVGDTIQIQLDEVPTSGFRWEITELNKTEAELISEEYKNHQGARVGGSGKKTIQIKIAKKGKGHIKLSNHRSGSKNVDKTFEITYTAK